ncbi:MAG TPA: hypothetical protein VLC09_13800, partial [Polyangiaceae bacterium]|nr:hypothetical protein [Polyangiaceae bacterium]
LPIVSYGVGAVGIGAGVVLLVLAGSDSSAADAIARDECSAGVNGSLVCSQDESDRITGLDADAATKQTLAWVGFGVGAVGAALGTYFLLAPSSSGERATAKLPTIAPLPGGAFVSYRASF